MDTVSDEQDSVVIHEDYIEVIWIGPQDRDKVRQTNIDALKGANELTSRNKPILLLIEVRNHPLKPNIGAFKEVLKIFQAVNFDRMAICGTVPASLGTLISTIISSFNKEFEIFTSPISMKLYRG
jgi:hypothetical protein